MLQFPYDIGSEVAVRTSVEPQSVAVANTGVAINGLSVDRQGESGGTSGGGTGGPSNAGLAQSCKVHARISATTGGSPTGVTMPYKVQDSADGSTGWADFKPDVLPGTGSNPSNVVAQNATGCTAAGTDSTLSVDLRMAKRYIRVVATPTLTGGGTSILVSAEVTLGGFPTTPVITPA